MLVSSACSSASESWDGRLLSFPFVAVLVQLVLSPAFVNLYLCWWRDSLKRPLWPDSRRLTLLVSLRTGAGADALSVHVARVHHMLPAEVILSPNSLLEARRCAVGSFRGAPPPFFLFFFYTLRLLQHFWSTVAAATVEMTLHIQSVNVAQKCHSWTVWFSVVWWGH